MAMDFDDLILKVVRLFLTNADIFQKYQKHILHVTYGTYHKDENEAIEGYENFLKYYGDQLDRKKKTIIRTIIKDEKRHIRLINTMVKSYIRGLTPR